MAEWIRRDNQTQRNNDRPSTVGQIIYYSILDVGASVGIIKSLYHFLRAIINKTTSDNFKGVLTVIGQKSVELIGEDRKLKVKDAL